MLLDQVYVSLELARQCLRPGRPDQRPGERAPAEGGQGTGGSHLRLDREPARHQRLLPRLPRRKTPWRIKLRTASYANVQALSTLLPGSLVPDLIAILGSMFFVVGDIDK